MCDQCQQNVHHNVYVAHIAQRQTQDLQPVEYAAAARSLVALAWHFWGVQEASMPASAA